MEIIKSKGGTGPSFPLRLSMSGTSEPLRPYLKALGALNDLNVEIKVLPFDTLAQRLASAEGGGNSELFLLMPWDFVRILDWRTGVLAQDQLDLEGLIAEADKTAAQLEAISPKSVFIDAPIPPVLAVGQANEGLRAYICSLAARAGANIIGEETFSLESYLDTGCPVASRKAYEVAEKLFVQTSSAAATYKVLVTDLDNVMWHGVIGEDGLDGISCAPEGSGFCHWIYQDFLLGLSQRGVVIAAVSRNDLDIALEPFRSGVTKIQEDDIAVVLASYNAKSAQIKSLADQLNLGLDAFVFVDDNPVEIAEVEQALPEVDCHLFPEKLSEFPEFLNGINRRFIRSLISEEDVRRTEMYRLSLASVQPKDVAGSDLTNFLRSLEMNLSIHDRTTGNADRAFDLINKTNQFNINGLRWKRPAFDDTLRAGGKLISATLSDKNGSYGEIAVCLIDSENTIKSFVVSCRVFQRHVENVFLTTILKTYPDVTRAEVAVTKRNTPAMQFFKSNGFPTVPDSGVLEFDTEAFINTQNDHCQLFEISYD